MPSFTVHPYFLTVISGKPACARDKRQEISEEKKNRKSIDHLRLFV